MSRPTTALTAALLGVALAGNVTLGQQSLRRPSPTPEAAPVDPMAAARGARHLLRNGLDYITYQEYERALSFLREAEARQSELNETEVRSLKAAIERAQRGLHEPANSGRRSYARSGSGSGSRPGAIAAARPAPTAPEPIQLAAATIVQAPTAPAPIPVEVPSAPAPAPISAAPATSFAPPPIDDFRPVVAEVATTTATPAPIPAEPEPGSIDPREMAAAAQPRESTIAPEAAPVMPEPLPVMPEPLPVMPEPLPVMPEPLPVMPEPIATAPEGMPDPGVVGRVPTAVLTAVPEPKLVSLILEPEPTPPGEIPSPGVVGGAPIPVLTALPEPEPESSPAFEPLAPAPLATPAEAPRPDPVVEPASATFAMDLPPLPGEPGPPLAVAESVKPASTRKVSARPTRREVALNFDPAELPPLPPEAVQPTPPPAPLPEAPTLVPTTSPAPVPVPSLEPEPLPSEPSMPDPIAAPASVPSVDRIAARPLPPEGDEPTARVMDPRAFSERVANLPSTLPPDLQRRVDEIARMQDADVLRDRAGGAIGDPMVEPDQPTARVELRRAPSPTEARPIRPIPVPEQFVSLAPRQWDPNRKYWSAAATCHQPLYFQDASLERYGHSVEQFFGPAGRYLTYPLDDTTQSRQRNQIVQPFFSIGLFAAQILALPYNLVVDPPWEAEYDLGYYRPGDRTPTDLYYLPLHGVGPPLHGRNY